MTPTPEQHEQARQELYAKAQQIAALLTEMEALIPGPGAGIVGRIEGPGFLVAKWSPQGNWEVDPN